MRRMSGTFAAVVVSGIIAGISPARAYDTPVHGAIAERAADSRVSGLDNALRMLGFDLGVNTLLVDVPPDGGATATRSATRWLGTGAQFEDLPEHRVMNHFHDPLAQTWETAGLRVGLQVGQSSVLWQQNPAQDGSVVFATDPKIVGGGNWSWQDARRLFALALTEPGAANRERLMARALQGIGHLTHLVQDASVPAHVRNDPHLYKTLFGFDIGNPDGYERWVDKLNGKVLGALLAAAPLKPPASIFAPTGSTAAPLALARLIDTKTYVGSNPGVLVGTGIGLAEYTNGNFFSGDTVFHDQDVLLGRIPFPAWTSVEEYVAELPAGTRRRYFVKVRDGETNGGGGYYLAVLSALSGVGSDSRKKDSVLGLDETVHADYAAFLLPRAVGYTAALIDYFFRGRLEVQVDGDHVTIVNRTPGETMDGSFTLYSDAADGSRAPLQSWTLTLGPDETSGPLASATLPAGTAPDARCILVFQGRLRHQNGAEEPQGVAGQASGCPVVPAGSPSSSPAPPPGGGPAPEQFRQLKNVYWTLFGQPQFSPVATVPCSLSFIVWIQAYGPGYPTSVYGLSSFEYASPSPCPDAPL